MQEGKEIIAWRECNMWTYGDQSMTASTRQALMKHNKKANDKWTASVLQHAVLV